MSISGTIPFFDHSTLAGATSTATVVTVTGATEDARATGTHSSEDLRAFFVRAAAALSVSGTQVAGGEMITSGALSGIINMQREIAMRIGDIDGSGQSAASRLANAQAALAVAGESQFGV